MELWIRSQKSEELRPMLLKVNEFEIGDYYEDMNCIVVNNLHCIGIYKTKERALEVLDEIQSILRTEPLVIVRSNEEKIEYKELSTYVYQMPEE